MLSTMGDGIKWSLNFSNIGILSTTIFDGILILPFFEKDTAIFSWYLQIFLIFPILSNKITMNFETTENNTINDLKRALEEKEAECKFLLEDLYLRK